MAGARLGMAFANPDIISYLHKVKYPYNINKLSQDAVLEALNNKNAVDENISILKKQRDKLEMSLSGIDGVKEVYPSEANFLLIKVAKPKEVYKSLISRGIVVRDRSSVPLCEGCLRITIGTEAENQKLLISLMEILVNSPA
jgi:histidinol-phosphate aminotransferase